MAASSLFETESTLTDRYQTTVPEPVRLALKLTKRDKVRYALQPNGSVLLTRVEQGDDADPVLEQFLGFMARDLSNHPERLQGLGQGLMNRIQPLVGHMDVDLDTPLSTDDE